MSRFSARTVLLLLVCLVAAGWIAMPGRAGAQPEATLVTIHPATGAYQAGDTINVEVWVENVTDLYGADVQLQFDPQAFQVLDANPSVPGVQISVHSDLLQPGFIVHREADNLAGTIWYANTQINPAPPVSGSGALFSFQMLARRNGSFPLTITSHDLSTKSGGPIPATAQNALYSLAGGKQFLPWIRRGG